MAVGQEYADALKENSKLQDRVDAAENALMQIGNFVAPGDNPIRTIIDGVLFPDDEMQTSDGSIPPIHPHGGGLIKNFD